MMKKKTLATLLTLTMLTTAAVPVFAAEGDITTDKGTGATKLTYTATENFIVVIPPNVTLENGIGTGKIEVTSATLDPSHSLNVSITDSKNKDADNAFRMILTGTSGDTAKYVSYVITDKDDKAVKLDSDLSTPFLSVASGVGTGSAELTYTAAKSTASVTGEYTDTLTFTATVK